MKGRVPSRALLEPGDSDIRNGHFEEITACFGFPSPDCAPASGWSLLPVSRGLLRSCRKGNYVGCLRPIEELLMRAGRGERENRR